MPIVYKILFRIPNAYGKVLGRQNCSHYKLPLKSFTTTFLKFNISFLVNFKSASASDYLLLVFAMIHIVIGNKLYNKESY